MNEDFAFLFKPGDYLRDTQCLSERVQVAYDRIMCEHMRNICITQKQLDFFTKRLNQDEKEELFMVLAVIEGGFEITWVAKSIRERIAYSESRRLNREGNPKKHMNNICKSYDNHMEGEGENEDNNIDKYREEKEIFDNFRKDYPGKKRGNDTEFGYLLKTHKDWRIVLPLLFQRLQYQKEARQVRKENKLFVEGWRNLKTWIYQRGWEDQINTEE